jgi:endonuclease YncB( thermonuclease family)
MRAPSLALVALAAAASAADPSPVVGVPAADRVVIRYQGLPVDVPLANLEVPKEPGARSACQQRLSSLVSGKKVDVIYKPGFGNDDAGAARVQIVAGGANVNELLVSGGYARYARSPRPEPEDEAIRKAQERAQSNKAGVWSNAGVWAAAADAPAPATDAPVVAANDQPAAQPAPAAPQTSAPVVAAPAIKPKGPFCSEINSQYFYPSDDRAVANVNPQRLIYYPDEATAKRAGKQPSPQSQVADIQSDGSEDSADKIFAQGKEIYAEAIAKGNTPERDQMYAQAYVVLSKAMQVYSALCEAHPDDDKLGEKLRQCMQLRYGSVKQRRFE